MLVLAGQTLAVDWGGGGLVWKGAYLGTGEEGGNEMEEVGEKEVSYVRKKNMYNGRL